MFGPVTRRALSRFQLAKGMIADGHLNRQALQSVRQAAAILKNYPAFLTPFHRLATKGGEKCGLDSERIKGEGWCTQWVTESEFSGSARSTRDYPAKCRRLIPINTSQRYTVARVSISSIQARIP
jgi:hypothetical protein